MKIFKILLVAIMLIFELAIFANEIVEVERPWDGYWWPMNEGALVNGEYYHGKPSTFKKYDAAFGKAGLAYNWEYSNHYSPDYEPWNGHCNGWACASILYNEPQSKYVYNSYVFDVGDMKGLLTEFAQEYFGPVYGTIYNSGSLNFEDINPFEFQQTIELYLKDNNVPVLMDADPLEEVWTYPIYKYELTEELNGNVKHMTCKVYCANDGVKPDTLAHYDFIKIYTYDLVLDSNSNVVNSYWTGNSVNDHPDFLWYPQIYNQSNPYIDIEDLNAIMNSPYNLEDDDSFENNDAESEVALLNAPFIGRLLDDDYYQLTLEPFESFSIKFYYNKAVNDESLATIKNLGTNETSILSDSDTVITANDFQYYNIEIKNSFNFDDNYIIDISKKSKTNVIPHLPSEEDWEVYIDFMTNDAITNGALLKVKNKNILESDSGFYPESDNDIKHFILENNREVDSLKINTLDGYIYSRTYYLHGNGSGVAISEDSELTNDYLFPHIPDDNFWWYGLSINNPNSYSDVNLLYYLYKKDRSVIEVKSKLEKNGKLVGTFNSLFPNYNKDEIDFIRVVSDLPISVLSLIGTSDLKCITGFSSNDFTLKQESYLAVDNLGIDESWIGLAFENLDNRSAKLQFYFYGYGGYTPISSTTLTMNSYEKKVLLLSDITGDSLPIEQVKYVRVVVSKGDVKGLALVGDVNHMSLSKMKFFEKNKKTILKLPYNLEFQNTTELHIDSCTFISKNMKVQLYDNNEELIDEAIFSVKGLENRIIVLEDLFDNSKLLKTNLIKITTNTNNDGPVLSYAIIKTENKGYELIYSKEVE